MCERVQFNIKLFGGIVMNKKKVKTLHSMMLKIVCLFSLGVILMSAISYFDFDIIAEESGYDKNFGSELYDVIG